MESSVQRARHAYRPRAATLAMLVMTTGMLVTALSGTSAQIPTTGQPVAPVFEGWEPLPDGSFDLVFGYFNRNWAEEIDVPIGPHNTIDPGGPDQGQPTHFYPRRSRFMFRVRVPDDFGDQEVVWTLTTNGKTERAYGTLNPAYFIDERVVQANHGQLSGAKNVAPVLKVEGDRMRHVKVGQAVTLTAVASDDGVPAPRPMPAPGATRTAGFPLSATGLRLSWFVYRGAGTVAFDPPQFKAWEDDRDGRNSPHSWGWAPPPVPPGGTWVVRATFGDPGTYVLRALAHDGGLFAAEDVTVVVDR